MENPNQKDLRARQSFRKRFCRVIEPDARLQLDSSEASGNIEMVLSVQTTLIIRVEQEHGKARVRTRDNFPIFPKRPQNH